jgi:hypothetical protein
MFLKFVILWSGHSGIPDVPYTVDPTDDACFLFFKFFILWLGHSGISGVPSTVGPRDDACMLSVLQVFYSMVGHSGIPSVPPTVGPGSSTQCGPDWIPPWLLGYLTDWQHWPARKISSHHIDCYADGQQMNYTSVLR